MTPRFSDVLELVRAPAILTVIGDAVVGAASARGGAGIRAVPLSSSSACLYAAGMALNDVADAELDAVERPERPIPSGRVRRSTAFGIGAILTAVGIGVAFSAGRAAGLVSLATAASVWTYDLAAKPTPAGPAVMALCRGLDVMMGAAGPGWRRGLLPAAVVAAHTLGVTALSRGEVAGTSRTTAGTVAATSVAAAAAATFGAGTFTGGALVGGASYLASTLPSQLTAAREPTAAHARTATRQGIRSMIPLQTALVARAGSVAATAFLLGVDVAGHAIARARTKGDVT
ncbi:SCO3242 family prenyltransferase [Microbacterium rhizomatis]|uniref:4-hydroxybenzoate polyprenyltransferase n=1 Tax=Microbacterium rhizomatis TaxID=1631477 RepID=A0A5J5J1P9_9MICO|nr:UbiA family prenyltransferase [Microbacterium rhizomatis]KAA9107619.1 4-hydroxybenzoate polyprenyltransferase [Microbacterium rhizomatis]